MNFADYILLAFFAALLFFAVRYLRRVKKSGGCAGSGSCGASCASCSSRCHAKNNSSGNGA